MKRVEMNVRTGQLVEVEILPQDIPAPPPVSVPKVVTRFQARAALLQAGLLPQVEALMANATPMAKIAWSDVQEFRRTSPLLLSMAAAMNLTSAQLDQLFITASGIEA
jgi:hypothetical protein